MNDTYQKNQFGISKAGKKMKALFFLVVFMFSVFGMASDCFGYVTPDWKAQTRANERQKPHTKPVKVNYKKQERDNKKQKIHEKGVKINKAKQKKDNKNQEIKTKPYKYDREAEQRINALQKPK